MAEPKRCPKHDEPLVKIERKWYCQSCIYAAHLTCEAQKEAQRRWRESERGKQKISDWEKGPGKPSRQRYLKGPKYKAARRRYNDTLKESLEIARSIRKEAMATLGPEMLKQKMDTLTRDIKDYMSWGTRPKLEEIVQWAEGYNLTITLEQAQELIERAKER